MSSDARLRALEEELEALQCADNLLQSYTRLPDVKTPAEKLLLGDILVVEESSQNNISFKAKFDNNSFRMTIQTQQLTVSKLTIESVDVVSDLQTINYIEMLKTKAESQLNPTLFLQGMSKWCQTKLEYEKLINDLYERLLLDKELTFFDGDTFTFNNGSEVSLFLDLKAVPTINVFFCGHMITHLFSHLSVNSITEVVHGLLS